MTSCKRFGVDYDYLFKILIIGDSGVGKSSLLLRFADDTFTDSHIATIGVDFKIRTVLLHSKKVKLQIWDTAGQERFKTITSCYFRSATAIFLVYDITNLGSLRNLTQKWLQEVRKLAADDVVLMVIGNKSDISSKREVSYEMGREFAEKLGLNFLETSAKCNSNVEQAFTLLAEQLVSREELLSENSSHRTGSFDLSRGKDLDDEDKNRKYWFICC